MKPKFRQFKKRLSVLALAMFLSLQIAPTALAQQNFNPPSVLPGDNTNIGGFGDACIGLANMVRQGTITLRQIPCFIKFFAQSLIAIAGSIAVIFVMVGGYRYVIGNPDDKGDAKRTITNALIGLAVALLAWIIVDLVLQLATE